MKSVKDVMKEVLNESDKKFWKKVYDDGEEHWTKKKPSNLTKSIVKKYGKFDRILEIGCAAGIDTFLLATIARKEIVGIDIVPEAVEMAKENLKEQSKGIRDKVKFRTGDAEDLKYKDEAFDFVYSLSVLHTTDINKSLKEIRRVLNDEGKAVIYVFIGKGRNELNPKEFISVCEKYFDLTEKPEEVEVQDKEEKHKALIVHLEVKNED